MSSGQITCAQFVELVTDYLEAALDPDTEARFERHARDCPGCDTYLDQFRETIWVTGQLERESVDPAVLDRLLAAFGDWRDA